jgi:hypothetical protein
MVSGMKTYRITIEEVNPDTSESIEVLGTFEFVENDMTQLLLDLQGAPANGESVC